jgi:uncharacterized protein (TIGR03435 family)
MKPDRGNFDDILKRYWPPASPEDMQMDMDRVRDRLQAGTARSLDLAGTQSGVNSRWQFGWRMAMAATASILLLAAAGMFVWRYSKPFAVVEGVADEILEPGDTFRTPAASGAQIRLADGSRIEMRSSSDLRIERTNDGVRILLNTGGVIVNAAKQHGHLYVQTKDITVSVVGTVFLVNAEREGSRVGVIEGEVRVERGATNSKLLPGQKLETNPLMDPVSLQEAVSWSRNAELHVALLEQSIAAPPPSPPRLEFEEIVIRRSQLAPAPQGRAGGDVGGFGMMSPCPVPNLFQIQTDPSRFMVSNATLFTLVAFAYGKDCSPSRATGAISGGPEWIRSELFDVQATIPTGAFHDTPLVRDPKLQAMLQAMLKERFQLAVNRGTKEMPSYDLLLVDKTKLKVSASNTPVPWTSATRPCQGTVLALQSVPMATLASSLSAWLSRPVTDRAGVEELIDVCFTLEVNREWKRGESMYLISSFFRGVTELGLKLQPSVASVETIVIERAEHPPEN